METEKKEASQKSGWVEIEKERVRKRREALGLNSPDGFGNEPWGLALSGGGIRSATFALGVLQALAKAKLLSRFDYLSTVSGGGYLGSLFTSLFVHDRLQPKDTSGEKRGIVKEVREAFVRGWNVLRGRKNDAAKPTAPGQQSTGQGRDDVARQAYEVMENDPPRRIRSGEPLSATRRPLAWLRENGRYLTPTGAGDFIYTTALALRNWCALHFVIGTAIVAAVGVVVGAKAAIAWGIDWLSSDAIEAARGLFEASPFGVPWTLEGTQLWWSPLWILLPAVALAWLAPSGLAYWLVSQRRGLAGKVSILKRLFSGEMITDAGLAALFGIAAYLLRDVPGPLKWLLAGFTLITTLAAALNAVASAQTDGIAEQRVWLTRLLANGLIATAVLAVLAAVDTASQTLYFWLMLGDSPLSRLLTPTAAFGAILWLVRKGAALTTEKAAPKWLELIPINLIAGLIAAVLLFALATAWATLVQWVAWQGALPLSGAMEDRQYAIAIGFAIFALCLAGVIGRFPGFINLSTLHEFYSSRLTRAYLGGSNGARFEGPDARRWASAAEPHPKDNLSSTEYFADSVHAPVHLINVTMNQTVDPAEQLVQRDRKGKLLVVGPAGYLLDGVQLPIDKKKTEDLSIGQWIGLSGAAVTTGLGRTTSLGLSLLLGLANVRLGRWWQSGSGTNESGFFGKMALTLFPTQTYLFYEFTAHFHGTHRQRQYLSDGGHYENTAAYELLRPQREVSLVVVSDAGCDENYQFADLANLIRLARIDFQAEIRQVADFPSDRKIRSRSLDENGELLPAPRDGLGKIFGTTDDFKAPEACALLFHVSYPEGNGNPRWLIALKPRVIAGVSADVVQYQREQPKFPQQSTADQFFDEAQWESYRRLGLEIGSLVFARNGGDLLNFLRERSAVLADAGLRAVPDESAARPAP